MGKKEAQSAGLWVKMQALRAACRLSRRPAPSTGNGSERPSIAQMRSGKRGAACPHHWTCAAPLELRQGLRCGFASPWLCAHNRNSWPQCLQTVRTRKPEIPCTTKSFQGWTGSGPTAVELVLYVYACMYVLIYIYIHTHTHTYGPPQTVVRVQSKTLRRDCGKSLHSVADGAGFQAEAHHDVT